MNISDQFWGRKIYCPEIGRIEKELDFSRVIEISNLIYFGYGTRFELVLTRDEFNRIQQYANVVIVCLEGESYEEFFKRSIRIYQHYEILFIKSIKLQ